MRTTYTTSFSPVDDRFEFSRKGSFRCRNDLEVLYSVITVLAAIAFLVLVFSIYPPSMSLAYYVFGILRIFAPPACVLACIAIIRVILMGYEYKFTANEEKMLIVCPKIDLRCDIYYDKVKNVAYDEYRMFGKIRGYHVTVTCTDQTFRFDFVFPSKCIRHEDYTPFRILEERSGLLEKPEYIAGQRIDNI